MAEHGQRGSSLRRRLSCRLSIFRRPSKRTEDERPKSRKLVQGPGLVPRFQDIMEATNQEKYLIEDPEPNMIGDLADELNSHSIRKLMETAEKKRDTERRRSMIQLGFRLSILTGRQNAQHSMDESETHSLLHDEEESVQIGTVQQGNRSRPVSMIVKNQDLQSPGTRSRNFESQSSSRPASMIFRDSPSSSRPDSMMLKRSETPNTSRPRSVMFKSPEPYESPRSVSVMGRRSESRASSRPPSALARSSDFHHGPSRSVSSMLMRTPELYAAEPIKEVGIRVGEFDPKLRKPYVFSPLQSDRVIRLLSFRRPSVDGTKGGFYYQIMTMSLDDPVPYEAVSYVWGNFDRNCRLNFMDGSFLPITESLASSMLDISMHSKTGYIWIDQICVNHGDYSERNHQTKIAGDITRRASRLLVSLNLSAFSIRTLFPLLDLAALYETSQKSVVDLQWALARYIDWDPAVCPPDSIYWRCVYELVTHAWFSRIWVFGEVVLSRTVSFIFEERLVPFDTIVRLALAISRLETVSERLPAECVTTTQGFHQLYTMLQHQSDRNVFGRSPDFWQLLSETAPNSRCADNRDSLYALLGFLDDDSIKIQPNYRTDRHDVFIDAARCFIEGKLNLDVLSFIPRANREFSREEGIPSWVPDWSKQGDIVPLTATTKPSPFKAAMGRPHYELTQHRTFRPIRLLLNRLKVKGRIIDTVSDAKMESFSDPNHWIGRNLHEYLRLDEILSYLQQWSSSSSERLPYTRERILKVLLADGALLHETPEFSQGVYLADAEMAELALAYRHFDSPDPFDSSRFQLASYARNVHTLRSLSRIAAGRRLFVGEDGKLGLAHQSIENGDLICILHGSKTPVILRPRGDGWYETKGQCYFEDAMHGEALTWEEEDAEEFVLV
jgi:hypothetical protein